MIKIPILSNPKHGWCDFCITDGDQSFTAALSYLTDVMYDTLKMCLIYLQTGAAAVMYNREEEGTFLLVLSDYDVYVLDENLPSGMLHLDTLKARDICQNIIECYNMDTSRWVNFANMEYQDKNEYKKYERKELEEITKMIKEIRKKL